MSVYVHWILYLGVPSPMKLIVKLEGKSYIDTLSNYNVSLMFVDVRLMFPVSEQHFQYCIM